MVSAQDAVRQACGLTTSERIVSIGDIHGAHDRLVAILRAAGLIDDRERWIGERAVLVQTGDVLDRGPDSRRALDLLRRLEGDAEQAGGQVHVLLGNHELMRLYGDLRDVSDGEYDAFRTLQSLQLRDLVADRVVQDAAVRAVAADERFNEDEYRRQYLRETPLGSLEMQIAFGPEGDYGRWLRQRDAMITINGIAFVHGGIGPAVASMGCEAINRQVRTELQSPTVDPQALLVRQDGPFADRALALEDEDRYAASVEAILRALGARAIVVGHTVAETGRIAPRFGGRVLPTDTGMLNGEVYPNGRASALEIRGETLTAIYEDDREPLGTLPRLPAAH
jgi:hypothetical protein